MRPNKAGQRVRFIKHYVREYPRITAEPQGAMTVQKIETSELNHANVVVVKDEAGTEFSFFDYWLTTTGKKKNGVKVYLIINTENQPGRVLAVMADEEDANRFADTYEAYVEKCDVEERTLFYGQPSNCGYNK